MFRGTCYKSYIDILNNSQEVDDDDEAVGGFDFTAGEGTFSQDDYTMQPDSSLNNTTLMGDKLVSQPNKVSLSSFDF